MALIQEDATYTQIVRFDVAPEKQQALMTAIVAETERWICRRAGFVSATLHAGDDGRHVINYAQWQDEDAFRGFLQDPQTKVLHAAIQAVDATLKPHAIHCHVFRSIEVPRE